MEQETFGRMSRSDIQQQRMLERTFGRMSRSDIQRLRMLERTFGWISRSDIQRLRMLERTMEARPGFTTRKPRKPRKLTPTLIRPGDDKSEEITRLKKRIDYLEKQVKAVNRRI